MAFLFSLLFFLGVLAVKSFVHLINYEGASPSASVDAKYAKSEGKKIDCVCFTVAPQN